MTAPFLQNIVLSSKTAGFMLKTNHFPNFLQTENSQVYTTTMRSVFNPRICVLLYTSTLVGPNLFASQTSRTSEEEETSRDQKCHRSWIASLTEIPKLQARYGTLVLGVVAWIDGLEGFHSFFFGEKTKEQLGYQIGNFEVGQWFSRWVVSNIFDFHPYLGKIQFD